MAAAKKKPVISITGTQVTEGNSGSTDASLQVKLSKKAKKTASAAFATAPGTAGTSDYTPTNGKATIKKGKKTTTIAVAITGDTTDEPDEQFTVKLSKPKNAKLGTATATVTITDDDEPVVPTDTDADGITDDVDNCPSTANPDQADTDDDGHGDVCDVCPAVANPGDQPCPATIYAINKGDVPTGQPVRVQFAHVSAMAPNTIWIAYKSDDAAWSVIDGSNYSAIEVDTTGLSTGGIAVGDIVLVDGIAGPVIDASTVTEIASGTPVTPISETSANLGANQARLDGVLISLNNVAVTNAGPPFTITDGTQVTNRIFSGLNSYPVATSFSLLTGIADTGGATPKLYPRDSFDVTESCWAASRRC